MAISLLGLGSNLGDPPEMIRQALARLAEDASIEVTATSTLQRTLPVGGPAGQGPFVNVAAVVRTSLAPRALLDVLQTIERQLGRRPGPRWGPRPIDLDLLLYDRSMLDTPSLVVPHPRMVWRRFVLEPAAEVAPEMIHPGIGWTVAELLANINTPHPYVAIAGPDGAGTTRLARAVAERTGARLLLDPGVPGQAETVISRSEISDRRAELLDATAPEWSAGRLTVSDFWSGEPHPRPVVRPTLLVLLDPASAGPSEPAAAFRRGVARPGVGPVLRLTSGDPDGQLAEVLAAIASIARPA